MLRRSLSGNCIQIEIEFNDVYSRFTEEAELASIGVLRDQVAHGVFRHFSFTRDARNLKVGAGERDVGIQDRKRMW